MSNADCARTPVVVIPAANAIAIIEMNILFMRSYNYALFYFVCYLRRPVLLLLPPPNPPLDEEEPLDEPPDERKEELLVELLDELLDELYRVAELLLLLL